MKMILSLIVMLEGGGLGLLKIESNEILSCSLWIEKNIVYKDNPLYKEGNGELCLILIDKQHICFLLRSRSTRKERTMKRKLKVKFSLIVPCEKEIRYIDEQELYFDNKESFLLACSDENDCQEIII